jgi:hypothetical protein
LSADALRLLDAWLAPADAGAPVACIATTFTFDPVFFEEECLARFLGLDSAVLSDSGAADAAYYVIQREAALEEARATVLVDRGEASSATSHRWDVVATGAPPGGVQHAKVSVLMWENVVRLIVGSANLTLSGYRSNIEVFWTFDWPSSERVAHLFASAADFLEVLLKRHTTGDVAAASPRGRARETVAALRERVDTADIRPASRGEAQLELVHTLNDGTLIDQAFDACWREGSPSQATVVSPYFVSRAAGAETRPAGLDAVRQRLSRRGQVACEVAVTAVELPNAQVRIEAPEEICASAGRGELYVSLWRRSDKETDRTLHAKVMCWVRNNWTLLLMGSANCTGAGLGLEGAPRNVELCIAIGDRLSNPVGRALGHWLPVLEPLPAGELLWDRALAEEDGAFAARLPDKFHEALYHPEEDSVTVELGRDAEPHEWEITDADAVWFTSTKHGGEAHLLFPLGGDPPPLKLAVRWQDRHGDRQVADLVVNVADRAALPPPPELGELTLEEMLDLLSAGSRFRSALQRVLRRRGLLSTAAAGAAELDPHARVDTSGFVLQRMRRAGRALEGLRERLERPVAHRDAAERRLRGPFSPAMLGEQLAIAREDGRLGGREHAFLVAELILCLRTTVWQVIGEEFDVAWCDQQVEQLIGELASGLAVEDRAIADYLARARGAA